MAHRDFDIEAHRQELRDAGLDDFRVFLANFWDWLSLPDPTGVQYDLASYLQHGPRRRVIQAFRGVGKSWITVAYVLWRALWNPDIKIMVVSAGGDIADQIAGFCHVSIMEWDVLEALRPRPGQKASAIHFDFGATQSVKDPSLKSVGITGQITSSRADIIVVDDVEIPKNSYTQHMRDRLAKLVKEFDAVLKPGGEIIYLGTPQVEDTLYTRLLNRGYQRRVWPAEVPERPGIYRGDLAPYIQQMCDSGVPPGTPTDPKRFDEQDLMERLLSYGRAEYNLQYMLDTTASSAEKHPLKCVNLIVTDVGDLTPVQLTWGKSRPLMVEGLQCGGFDGDYFVRPALQSEETAGFDVTLMAIDPSGQGEDETAAAVVRLSHGMLYLCEVGGWKDGYGERTLSEIAQMMLRWKVNKWIDEKNYGGGMFTNLLSPVLRRAEVKATRDEDYKGWAKGNKEQRICSILEPVTQAHRLVVNRKVIEDDLKVQEEDRRYSLIYQYTRMSREKGAIPHDDRVEAVSMAVGYFERAMRLDTEQSVQRHKQKLIDEEIRKFHAQFGGNSAPNWRDHLGTRAREPFGGAGRKYAD